MHCSVVHPPCHQSTGVCAAQYIGGRTVFDGPASNPPPLAPAAIALVVLGAVAAVAVMAGAGWMTWRYRVHGKVPSLRLWGRRKAAGPEKYFVGMVDPWRQQDGERDDDAMVSGVYG